MADTLAVGGGLCHRDAVEFTVSRSRATVEWLAELGVDFDLRQDVDHSSSPEYHLAQEGGHSQRLFGLLGAAREQHLGGWLDARQLPEALHRNCLPVTADAIELQGADGRHGWGSEKGEPLGILA